MGRKARFSAVIAGVVTLVGAPAAQAQAVVTQVPIAAFGFNQCAGGELITFTGTLHIVQKDEPEHVINKFVLAGVKAQAPATGAQYVLVQTLGSSSYSEPDGTPGTLTVVQRQRFVRIGEDKSYVGGDDFAVDSVLHVTTTPDGTVTANFERFEVSCF